MSLEWHGCDDIDEVYDLIDIDDDYDIEGYDDMDYEEKREAVENLMNEKDIIYRLCDNGNYIVMGF